MIKEHPITKWLRANEVALAVYTGLCAFALYTCIYAFRKAFPAATFEDINYGGIKYKVWLVIFQAIGYALSKVAGIKLISELKKNNRSKGILIITGIAGFCWLLFGIIPKPLNIIFLFVNGLTLGLVWGIIFSYLEGRKITEVLGAALSISFIFSSGLSRSVGATLITQYNIQEIWMPFIACLIFLLPLRFSLWLLDKVPPPTVSDETLRTKRVPMNHKERRHFLVTFLPGIIFFITCYVLLTTFRDFRDNFSPEVWKKLGYENPEIFTTTEIPVSLAILVIMGAMILVKNNYNAFALNHLLISTGLALTGISSLLFESGNLSPFIWMTLLGLGLYMAYVPFNSIFFDRMLATFRYSGTVGFIMYLADSFGYLGSLGILLVKELSYPSMEWIQVFIQSSYILSVTGILLISASWIYFDRKYRSHVQAAQPLLAPET